jgi:hypothetical protein
MVGVDDWRGLCGGVKIFRDMGRSNISTILASCQFASASGHYSGFDSALNRNVDANWHFP